MLKSVLIFISFIFLVNASHAQGCSDAGFCTAGNIKPTGINDSIKSSIGLTIGYAIGEQGVIYITPQLEPQVKITDKSMVQLKVPVVFISGDAGKTNGLGDIIITYNHQLKPIKNKNITLIIGSRIATGTASLKANNIPLPMPYQTSLGTTDLILGAQMQFKKGYSLSLGYQQPFFNRNQNGFDSMAYKNLGSTFNIPKDQNYFISSSLQRKGDILLRLDKRFILKKTTLSVGLLPIYHLGNDQAKINKYTTQSIENSKGLTLNLNGGIYYKMNPKIEVSAVFATPLIVRQSRPDGLTRSVVAVMGLRYFY